ncbi:MAG: polysulfide reductase NrfD [Dehalococcoidales bacterium]|nr:polysulfide reductase NrfD [Dehalococcoidales bacterium]
MALRQWMVTHDWMVKPTAQTEWIERRGILVWIAEVFTSLGAGLYLVSLFFDNWWGMLAGWIIIMFLKIPLHIMYFGKPLRFWRTIIPFTSSWKTSWFTRGINFNVYFGGVVFIQLVVGYLAMNLYPGTTWESWYFGLGIIGGIFAFLVGIYSGFIMSYCKSVPFWNTAMLPIIILLAGVADGFALMLAVGMADTSVDIAIVEFGSRVLLAANIIMMAAYIWNSTYQSKTSKYTALLLVKGALRWWFWIGVVILGMIIPLVISSLSLFAGEATTGMLILAIVFHTAGAVSLKYVLLKAGVHTPLLPTLSYSHRLQGERNGW